ncbi:MAG: uroporphyrinogen-III C-methyltransferase [Acidobacteria bacterium]|nr:uroporphyrinogen-III C-methyltransferase [Acidobacteriota bacterium]
MKGKVSLVGAGPGDPELMTLKAADRLRLADVILHDALVSPEVLQLASPRARLLNVGKRCGEKGITQAEINGLLITFAQQGNFVVRLKSGDPLVFGRAGEELTALRQAGIEVEVVPGVTSALGAAAAAQISLTDRRAVEQILFLSGHHACGKAEPDHWSIPSRTTVVVYMPGEHRKIAERLMRSGFEHATACLVISSISLPSERAYRTSLGQLSLIPLLPSPSLLIIGSTVDTAAVADHPPLDPATYPDNFEPLTIGS